MIDYLANFDRTKTTWSELEKEAKSVGLSDAVIRRIRDQTSLTKAGSGSTDNVAVAQRLIGLAANSKTLAANLGVKPGTILAALESDPFHPLEAIDERTLPERREKYEEALRKLGLVPQPAASGAGQRGGGRRGWWTDEKVAARFVDVMDGNLTPEARMLKEVLYAYTEAPPEEVLKALDRVAPARSGRVGAEVTQAEVDTAIRSVPTHYSQPPLRPLHPDSSLSPATLQGLGRRSTPELIDSLRPGQPEALRVRPDGTIINGHHRIKILRDRRVDVDALPREVIPRDTSAFPDLP
jgi:hypothetical protein